MPVIEAQAGGRCGVESVSHGSLVAGGASLLRPAVAAGLGVWGRRWGQGSGDRGGKTLVREMKTAATGHICIPWVGGIGPPVRGPASSTGLAVLSWDMVPTDCLSLPLFYNHSFTHVLETQPELLT